LHRRQHVLDGRSGHATPFVTRATLPLAWLPKIWTRGETGHYTIGALACTVSFTGLPRLKKLMSSTLDRIGFKQRSPTRIPAPCGSVSGGFTTRW
jgi:hypothetical protein